jgi:hypothetical protein
MPAQITSTPAERRSVERPQANRPFVTSGPVSQVISYGVRAVAVTLLTLIAVVLLVAIIAPTSQRGETPAPSGDPQVAPITTHN